MSGSDILPIKTFTQRLETFKNYTGLCNVLQLCRLGYYHHKNNQIICQWCKNIFICWNQDEHFWIKHKENLCKYTPATHMVHNVEVKEEDIEVWLKKNYIMSLIREQFSEQQLRSYLDEFLRIKGTDSSLRLFKEFFNYKLNFCN